MEKCWATQPSKRATFTDVADALDALVAKCDADASTRFVACKCVSVHVLRLLLHMAMYLSHLHKEYMESFHKVSQKGAKGLSVLHHKQYALN